MAGGGSENGRRGNGQDRGQMLRTRAIQLGFLAVVLLAWHLVTSRGMVNPLILPAFTDVVRQFGRIIAGGTVWGDLAITLMELAIAFSIAVLLGGLVGYLVSQSAFRVKVFGPLISGLYSIPGIVIYPLYVLFFGLGVESKIAIGATIAFFPMTLNTITAFTTVDAGLVTAARSMGASRRQLALEVMVPAALPTIVTGIRMCFIIAFLVIIGTETIASLAGLGHQIVNFGEMMNMPVMFAYIVFVIVIALVLNGAVTALENRARGE